MNFSYPTGNRKLPTCQEKGSVSSNTQRHNLGSDPKKVTYLVLGFKITPLYIDISYILVVE